MDVSTIIVSYNTYELTLGAIRSAFVSSPEVNHEVIVVDNNSPDGSARKLQEIFPSDDPNGVTIIALQENRGFAFANNVGAARARGKVLFFLNPDTVVMPGTVAELFEFLTRNESAGAVGPHVVNPDGSDQSSVSVRISALSLMRHFLPFSTLLRPGWARTPNSPRHTRTVDVVMGCALAVRRDAFDSVGGWDESYFLYAEETELCYSLRRAGFENYFLRPAQIVHYGGASTAQEDYAEQQIVQQRSALAFLKRHHGRFLVRLNRLFGILGFGMRTLLFPLAGTISEKSDFRMRAKAARKIFAWFLFDYS